MSKMVGHPEVLPPCEGPKLNAFPYHNSRIKWINSLGKGKQGYVYKVEIESRLYALKVFRFFDIEETRDYWGNLFEGDFDIDLIAFHTDPFYAECRAYGKIKNAQETGALKRQIVIPCRGFILLSEMDRAILEANGCDLGDSTPGERVRAIVKDLASDDHGVSRNLGTILRGIKRLNKIGVYNRDIRLDNFRDGLLVDFGSSRTEPHCFLDSAANAEEEAKEQPFEDLVMFDEMVKEELENCNTTTRAMPNWTYCAKLRSRSTSN